MLVEEVKVLIESGLENTEVMVEGDGSHFSATVISDTFIGKSMLEQQKLVMATVNEQIRSGDLHALSIKSYTCNEWEKLNA